MTTDYLFGINAIHETLIAAPRSVREIFVSENSNHGRLQALVDEARRQGLPVGYRAARELDRLSQGQRHQGVVAIVEAYAYPAFEKLLQQIADAELSGWILILDGIVDPRNFGALLRTAEAAGVRHIVIPKDRSVEVTPLVVKASAGAAHHLSIYKVTNLRRSLQALKQAGYWTVGLAVGAKENFYDRDYPDKLAIVLGSEATGVRPINLRECDFLVSIPMFGKVASLNVGVAGAIFLFELVRQQRLPRS
jgi:23S rRNA (guanosine2251-2'-O)-methyltransferase